MEEYQLANTWEHVEGNLYRRESDSLQKMFYSSDAILMKKHDGKFISKFEYDEIMDNITTQTYDNLIREEMKVRRESQGRRNNIESLISRGKSFLSDLRDLDDRALFNKYFRW